MDDEVLVLVVGVPVLILFIFWIWSAHNTAAAARRGGSQTDAATPNEPTSVPAQPIAASSPSRPIARDLKVALITILACSTGAALVAWRFASAEVDDLRTKVDALEDQLDAESTHLRDQLESLDLRISDVEVKVERR